MQLVSLSAGVINAGRASATQRQANYGPAFSVGGQRDNTSVVLIDGMEISGQELNNYPLAIPPLDSLAEFRVQTANYSAEFGGNSGAVINVVSKRGSNAFHSTLFEFLRNDALDARNSFSATVDPLSGTSSVSSPAARSFCRDCTTAKTNCSGCSRMKERGGDRRSRPRRWCRR